MLPPARVVMATRRPIHHRAPGHMSRDAFLCHVTHIEIVLLPSRLSPATPGARRWAGRAAGRRQAAIIGRGFVSPVGFPTPSRADLLIQDHALATAATAAISAHVHYIQLKSSPVAATTVQALLITPAAETQYRLAVAQ